MLYNLDQAIELLDSFDFSQDEWKTFVCKCMDRYYWERTYTENLHNNETDVFK